MRGYATIFFNGKSREYTVQPAARGPVGTTDYGEPARIPENKFSREAALTIVLDTILKYQTQVFDRSSARRFSPEEYRKFLKSHSAVSARWEDSGQMIIRPLHPEGGGLAARDGEEILLAEEDVREGLIEAIIRAFRKAA